MKQQNYHRQAGISLVEIMISLVVGLILTAGVIRIYAANKQTYRVAEASARVQENGRFAMDMLTRQIRMAGYQGCAGSARILVNTLNDTSSFLFDFGTAVQGFEATGNGWDPQVDSSITEPLAGRDIITIRGVFGNGTKITGQPSNTGDCNDSSSYTADLKISSTAGLSDGDIVVAGNCSRASIFQITNINVNQNVVHNTGGSQSPGNATKNLGACYAGNGELFVMNTRSFYIRNNASGIPSLYRKDGTSDAEELVEGVEDMQILYGYDSDGDGLVDEFVQADTVDNANAWDRVLSARISLLLYSVEDNITSTTQSVDFNGSTLTPTDRRLRRVFTTTIGLRNLLP